MATMAARYLLGKRADDEQNNGGLGGDSVNNQYDPDDYDNGDYSWWWSPVSLRCGKE